MLKPCKLFTAKETKKKFQRYRTILAVLWGIMQKDKFKACLGYRVEFRESMAT